MKNYSTKTTGIFILDVIFTEVMLWILYNPILFRCLEDKSPRMSGMILWAMAALSLGIFLWIFKHRKNGITVWITAIVPFGIYTLMAYSGFGLIRTKMIFGVSAGVSMLYTVLLMTRKIRKKSCKKKIFRKKMRRCIYGIMIISAIGLSVYMISFGVDFFFTEAQISSSRMESESGEDAMKIFAGFDETVWKNLTVKERLDYTQAAADILAEKMGMNEKLYVTAANLREEEHGNYSDNIHTIRINIDYLRKSAGMELLKTCAHEVYHAYEYRLVDLYRDLDENQRQLSLMQGIGRYEEEFKSYVGGEEDFFEYYYQKCETDARDFAEIIVEEITRRLRHEQER